MVFGQKMHGLYDFGKKGYDNNYQRKVKVGYVWLLRDLAGEKMEASSSVSLTLNGRPVVVEGASALLSLNDWLRAQPGLTGTKKMCGEGGCGCCVVAATLTDPIAPSQSSTIAINSVGIELIC